MTAGTWTEYDEGVYARSVQYNLAKLAQQSEQVVEALTVDELRKVIGPLVAHGIGHSVVRACAEKWGLRLRGQQ
jgi:RecB family endonuclease NucS